MQKVILTADISSVAEALDPKVISYIAEGQTETFEAFDGYDLLSFDWYNVQEEGADPLQVLVYLDHEDLILMCENAVAKDRMTHLLPEGLPNEKALVAFFANLLKNDMAHLDTYEGEITDTEDEALANSRRDYLDKIVDYRRELLRLKRYYSQLSSVFEELVSNDNDLLSEDAVRRLTILSSRVNRFHNAVLNLRDYVTQMREAYQAQIDIEQNELMKIFTVLTAVFLPLTLLVGWYGMNFEGMPELHWAYSYPVFIGVSVLLSIGLIAYFKRRHWF
jgi:magnesium transporter